MLFKTVALIVIFPLAFTLAAETNDNKQNNLRSLIVGGTSANESEFQSYGYRTANDKFGCGATLIAPNIMLTAASCKGVFYNQTIKIGSPFLNGTWAESIVVAEEYGHFLYDRKTQENNIMLIRLKCASRLPIQRLSNFPTRDPRVSHPVTAIGFGVTIPDDTTAKLSSELQKVSLTVVGNPRCSAMYSGVNRISNNMICAGVPEGRKDTCRGDGGGPLLDSKGVQVGIISHGRECADPEYPGIYTRVSSYRSWIQSRIDEWSSKAYCQ